VTAFTDAQRWRDNAACVDLPTNAFFDDIWPEGPEGESPLPINEGALAAAREICYACPVRRACHEEAMDHEGARPAAQRFGLTAILTPQQRHTLQKRRWKCKCGAVLDPAVLQKGRRECPVRCGVATVKTPPIPDAGEEWTKRHTEAARKVLVWVNAHVETGQMVPAAIVLHKELGIRRGDVDRVYAALVQDGEFDRDGRGGYRRVSDHIGTMAAWYLPPHERID
jgi:hypothetical protein